MQAEFKYFRDPERFAVILSKGTECDICHRVRRCFDASVFYGRERYTAFCFECVAAGRLAEVGAFGVNGDYGALKRQLQALNPGLPPDEVEQQARAITVRFEATTPKLLTWQDWAWPAHCGDYCQFVRMAGQADFNALAENGDGKRLFSTSLCRDLSESAVDDIWTALKPGSIGGISDPADNWSPMAYIFRCLKCGAIVTGFDMD
jgi:uncharacterized protein CbrC (UPF0167 family)